MLPFLIRNRVSLLKNKTGQWRKDVEDLFKQGAIRNALRAGSCNATKALTTKAHNEHG
jgi:hypothetical protein